jgi:phage shock protein PspC (stress-responsive transcriptional regulator)
MYRSFTDRVFGGVCGGIGARLGVNPWWLRIAFGVLALLSAGGIALLYLMLWWALPQQSPVETRRYATGTLWLVVLVVIMAVLWLGRGMGWLHGPAEQALYWPAMLLVLSAVFLWRQVRG